MTIGKRNGNKWTINETLSLQREFELLNLSLDEIAKKHQRTVSAIMFKLNAEGFADYNDLYDEYYNMDSDITLKPSISECNDCSSVDDDDEVSNDDRSDDDNEYNTIEEIADRIWNLETNMKDIGNMISRMFQSHGTPSRSYNFLER